MEVHMSRCLFVLIRLYVKYTDKFLESDQVTTFLITPTLEECTRPWSKRCVSNYPEPCSCHMCAYFLEYTHVVCLFGCIFTSFLVVTLYMSSCMDHLPKRHMMCAHCTTFTGLLCIIGIVWHCLPSDFAFFKKKVGENHGPKWFFGFVSRPL
jgi:hypothetical protein